MPQPALHMVERRSGWHIVKGGCFLMDVISPLLEGICSRCLLSSSLSSPSRFCHLPGIYLSSLVLTCSK